MPSSSISIPMIETVINRRQERHNSVIASLSSWMLDSEQLWSATRNSPMSMFVSSAKACLMATAKFCPFCFSYLDSSNLLNNSTSPTPSASMISPEGIMQATFVFFSLCLRVSNSLQNAEHSDIISCTRPSFVESRQRIMRDCLKACIFCNVSSLVSKKTSETFTSFAVLEQCSSPEKRCFSPWTPSGLIDCAYILK